MKLIVTAPGTTANIGPGYDCLGLALTLYSTFTFEPSDVLMIEGCDEAYRNADNLVIKGFAAVYRRVGKQMPPVHLTIEAGIPIARGLGSSSVCFVSGAFAANSFLGEPFSRDELFQLCSAFEGHPDNAAPCIYGGMTASFAANDGDGFHTLPMPIHPDWRFAAVIPNYEVHTADARRAMPKEISVKDSVYTTSHAIAILRALADGNETLLSEAAEDRLHEPCRRKLIPDWSQLRQIATDVGAAAFVISGSGSTMLAITRRDDVAEAFTEAVNEAFPLFKTVVLRASDEGVQVRQRD